MKFKVGSKVVVQQVYSGGLFEVGDIVEIIQIGDDDGFSDKCYGAISPHDGLKWYLQEDEVAPLSNADRIRAMSDEELSDFLCGMIVDCENQNCPAKEICHFHDNGMRKWIKQPAKEA